MLTNVVGLMEPSYHRSHPDPVSPITMERYPVPQAQIMATSKPGRPSGGHGHKKADTLAEVNAGTLAKPSAPSSSGQRRARGLRAIAQDISGLTAPAFARRGLAAGAIVSRWADVVGTALAACTIPERISFTHGRREDGTLVIRVESGALALELQHLAPQLIERVNSFFGYRAVERVKLTQGPLPKRRTRRTARQIPAFDENAIDPTLRARLAAIEDPDLRAALAGLAHTRAHRRD